MLVADDAMLQAEWAQKLQEPLDIASRWAGGKDGELSDSKCSYRKGRGERNEVVYLVGVRQKEAEAGK